MSNIYLDESGDLGWKFDAPYRQGGSSRYLTIAFIVCPAEKRHLIKRIVKDVYRKTKHNPKIELKGSSLNQQTKKFIATKTVELLTKHSDIIIGSITVKKENVASHIQSDPNKLYNYMIKLSLLDKISNYTFVNLIRDNRSIKVKSGNCLIDYLQTSLWFDMNSKTKVVDIPSDSRKVNNLIFIDWINNIIWGNYEDKNSESYNILKKTISEKNLFFH